MSQSHPSITERLRRVFAPKAQDELEAITAVQEHAERERDRAEQLFRRLRGAEPSRRLSWEELAGVSVDQEHRR